MNIKNHEDGSKDNNKDGELRSALRESAPFLGLGIQLAASMLMFFFIGLLVDNHWGISPVGKLVGIVLGVISGVSQFIRVAKRFQKR